MTGGAETLTGAVGGSGREGVEGRATGSVMKKSAVIAAGEPVRRLGGEGGAKASARLANSARSSSERSEMEESGRGRAIAGAAARSAKGGSSVEGAGRMKRS
jgi:hypothetical protein